MAFHYNLSDRRDRALPFLMQTGHKAIVEYADLLYYVALWHWHRDEYQVKQ